MSIKFSFHDLTINRQQSRRIDQLQTILSHLSAITQIDSARNYSINKIVAIIDRYNPKMMVELKFRIAAEIYEMNLKYSKLDIELICATITHETALTWDPTIISPAGAMGLMQILPVTGIYLAREEGIMWSTAEDILFDPVNNIRMGCRYLSLLINVYSIDGGLAAYNGGMKRAEQWVRNGRADGILHEETAFYVPSILKIYEEYKCIKN